ncbi:MAG: TolC family protein [Labilithrix sp.]|nr:TolC family protein [Labilithrix sp.]
MNAKTTFAKIAALVLVALSWATPARADAPAAEVPRLTEEEVLRRWLSKSPEVAAWRTQVGAARFDVVSARLWPNPEIDVGGSKLVGGTPPDGLSEIEAKVTVPLPVFGQVAARAAAASALVSVAEATVASLLWERASEIQRAMVERAYADARVVMLERNIEELDRIRRIVAVRATAGASGAYDVLRVDTAAGTIRATLDNARVERARADAKLVALVADPELTSTPIDRESLAAFRGSDDEGVLVRGALERRPDLALARRGARAAEAQATQKRREAIPTPSLYGGALWVQGPYGLQITAGVSVPLPLFDRNQGAIGRALAEAQGAELLARALETRIRAEVSGAWRARRDARAALDVFRAQSLVAATELLGRAERTYQVGAFSITELLDAHRTMWEARIQELDLDRQRAEAEAEVERAAVLLPVAPLGK